MPVREDIAGAKLTPESTNSTTEVYPLDPEAIEVIRSKIEGIDPQDVLSTLGAFLWWNAEAIGLGAPHFVVSAIADVADEAATRPCPPDRIYRILAYLQSRYLDLAARSRASVAAKLSDGSGLSGFETIREATAGISNPGTAGQMLLHAYERGLPFNDLIQTTLGFDIGTYCTTVRWALEWPSLRLQEYLHPGSPPYDRRRTQRNPPDILRPPNRLIRDYKQATLFPLTPERPRGLEHYDSEAIRFLSGNLADFGSGGFGFGRWGFLREKPGWSRLLLPERLADAATAAIHWGLLAELPAKVAGKYGNRLGREYETMVANRLRPWAKGSKVEPRLKFKVGKERIDIDGLVTLADGSLILLSCKGRTLRPQSRVGEQFYLREDIKRTLTEAASQALDGLDKAGLRSKTRATLIVTESQLLGLPYFCFKPGDVADCLAPLVWPLPISLFDLEYLMSKVPFERFEDYLRWRDTLLRTGRYFPYDEYDLVAAFEKYNGRVIPVRDQEGLVMVMNHDSKFGDDTMTRLDEAIGFDYHGKPRGDQRYSL